MLLYVIMTRRRVTSSGLLSAFLFFSACVSGNERVTDDTEFIITVHEPAEILINGTTPVSSAGRVYIAPSPIIEQLSEERCRRVTGRPGSCYVCDGCMSEGRTLTKKDIIYGGGGTSIMPDVDAGTIHYIGSGIALTDTPDIARIIRQGKKSDLAYGTKEEPVIPTCI